MEEEVTDDGQTKLGGVNKFINLSDTEFVRVWKSALLGRKHTAFTETS